MRRGFAAVLILLTLAVAGAKADSTYTYGGSGMDVITEIIPIEGGALAVGRTNSNDGTFSTRSRKGMAGWVLCLNEMGDIRWTHCTAHAGRVEFHSPYEHQNGMLSCVLGDIRTGMEWIWYNREGNAGYGVTQARIEIGRVCEKALPLDLNGRPALAVLDRYEDGMIRCSLMDEYGIITDGQLFEAHDGLEPFADRLGRIVFARQEDGEVLLRFVTPGASVSQEIAVAGFPEGVLYDASPRADGTLLFSGETENGGYMACVDAQGEMLFVVDTEYPVECVSASETGFSGLGFADGTNSGVLYEFDAGGKLVSSLTKAVNVEKKMMADTASGAIVIERTESGEGIGGVSVRQLEDDSQWEQILFRREGELLSAQADEEELRLFLRNGDGRETCLALREDGVKRVHAAYKDELCPGVTWQETPRGTRISRRTGETVVETNVPIHTAADRVEWLCASPLEDGGLLLGGRYISEVETENASFQQGILARLNSDGILYSLETLEDIGCVSGVVQAGEKTMLLVTRNAWMTARADEILELGEELSQWTTLSLNLKEAHLFYWNEELYAVGTERASNGDNRVLIRRYTFS